MGYISYKTIRISTKVDVFCDFLYTLSCKKSHDCQINGLLVLRQQVLNGNS